MFCTFMEISGLCTNLRQMAGALRSYSTEIRQQEPIIVFVDQKNCSYSYLSFCLQDQLAKTKLDVKKASLEEVLEKRANPVKREEVTNKDTCKGLVELKAMECPQLLKKDLKELFKGVRLSTNVCVLNLTQKTEHDMSAWSMGMELERLQLTAGASLTRFQFIEAALRICEILRKYGYWADFIDPSSGKPYLSKSTRGTLPANDERYRTLGFRVTDFGCCKVLEHGSWGTHAFVGTIFTDAPLHSAALTEILAVDKD
ncbi:unnamed protein product [Enterobius vermicularis]|uniref:Methylmalonic aciduria and homocystinuria type D-like protein, mitochondrial n=1 Tax=Enterobius vermicularis TaxID=51028 RepID=A0A0N4V8D7_ENTVE|nr:unnamed protein product [Enterobius vermicularis]